MTRAASGAKRSGAAAQYSSRLRVILPLPPQYLIFSFFAPRTPARWLRRRLRVRSGRERFAGSVVLHGTGGRTAKHLKTNGSVVLFWSPSRDARADACRRTRIENPQNHRTTEPIEKYEVSLGVRGSASVLLRFCSPGLHKKWGGYSISAFAGSIVPDQGSDGGAGRENFSAWARLGWAAGRSIEAGRCDRPAARGNGGFPPFPGVLSGRVGMAALERRAKITAIRGFAGGRCKPAGLRGVGLAAPIGVGGVQRPAVGGTPPSAAAFVPFPFAQPIFRISSDLRFRRGADQALVVGERRLTGGAKMGSGETDALTRCHGPTGAKQNRQERVGVDGGVLGRLKYQRISTLCGEVQGVN